MTAARSPVNITIQKNTRKTSSQPMVCFLVAGLKYVSRKNFAVCRRARGKDACVIASSKSKFVESPNSSELMAPCSRHRTLLTNLVVDDPLALDGQYAFVPELLLAALILPEALNIA